MKRLKSIFHTLYFSYLLISILLFAFQDVIRNQMDPEFFFRFLNFWVILGFAFFISIWVIQAIHIGLLKKDIVELETIVMDLKSKLYDFSRNSVQAGQKESKVIDAPMDDPDSSISRE
jgi:hypothetical protein